MAAALALGASAEAQQEVIRQFQCQGNEPFWRLEANGESGLLSRLRGRDLEETTLVGELTRLDFLQPPWRVWHGVDAEDPSVDVVATLRLETCRDTMSDEAPFDHRAIVVISGEAPVVGCCRATFALDTAAPGRGGGGLADLYDVEWRLEDIEGSGVVDSLNSPLIIDANGNVSGHAGCNVLTGTAAVDGADIQFGPLGSTRRMCAPAIMDQERRFLAALARAATWRVERGLLFLTDGRGRDLLRFSL